MAILLMNMIIAILRAAEALPEPVAGPMPQPEADAHYGYYGYGLIWIWIDAHYQYYGYGQQHRDDNEGRQ